MLAKEQELAAVLEQLDDSQGTIDELRGTMGEIDGANLRRFASIELREDELAQQIKLLRGNGSGEYALTSADEKHLTSAFASTQPRLELCL